MLIADIVDIVYGQINGRYQLSKDSILRIVSQVQLAAFSADIPAFIRMDQSLTLVVDESDPALMSMGPYSLPSDCRRLLCVTLGENITGDPSMSFPAERGRIDFIGKAWTFSENPDVDADYRWIYYRRPAELVALSDDAKILVPVEWHDRLLLNGATLLADRDLWGDRPMAELYNTILEPFWADMRSQGASSEPVVSSGGWL